MVAVICSMEAAVSSTNPPGVTTTDTQPAFTRAQVAECIERLLDSTNFLYNLTCERKRVQEKDVAIMKRRVATGRELIQALTAE